jgi:hypothetical protein
MLISCEVLAVQWDAEDTKTGLQDTYCQSFGSTLVVLKWVSSISCLDIVHQNFLWSLTTHPAWHPNVMRIGNNLSAFRTPNTNLFCTVVIQERMSLDGSNSTSPPIQFEMSLSGWRKYEGSCVLKECKIWNLMPIGSWFNISQFTWFQKTKA